MRSNDKIETIDYRKEITELRKELAILTVENEIMLKAKLEAEAFSKRKSEFLANMSHELRTPMHAILSFSKISLKKMGVIKRSKLRKNIEIVFESGHRLLHTLNDILDISKLESGKMEFEMGEYDLCKTLTSVIQELQSLLLDKGIKYDISTTSNEMRGYFDNHKVIQVLENIIGNAIKFTPIQGSVEVHISEEGDFLQVRVSNNGQPIPQAELETIFSKYLQSSAKSTYIGGTGLGLSIARQIIDSHDGQIWAECEEIGETHKTSFYFTIPKEQSPQTTLEGDDHA